MPTVIDSLIVTLGLDPSKFTQGQKDAATALHKTEAESERTAKRMEVNGKHAAMFFEKIKTEALGLAAALLGGRGIKEFTQYITTSDRAVGRLSRNLNLSIETLSAWEGVAGRFGSSAEDIDNAFRSTMKLVQDIQHGEVPADTMQWLARAGVDLSKFLDPATQVDDKLRMIQKAFANTSAAEAQFFGGRTGYSENTVNMLRDTAGSIDALIKKQKEFGVATRESEEAANKLAKAWKDMEDQAVGTARNRLAKITPYIAGAAEALQAGGNYIDETLIGGIQRFLGGSDLSAPGKGVNQRPAPSSSTKSTILRQKGKSDVDILYDLMVKLEASGEHAVSPKGAIGRGQVTPATARTYGFDPNRLQEPEYNEQVSKAILADLNQKFGGNVQQIMAAYNAGPNGKAFKQFQTTGDASVLPAETQKYLEHLSKLLASSGGAGSKSGGSVSIGQIVINTQATDAKGIAREIGPELQSYVHVLPSNPGLN